MMQRTDRSQRSDDSNYTHTAYVAARDCRDQATGLCAYLSVLEIRDLWRLREEAKCTYHPGSPR
jgi:hypothetical protein